LSVIKELIYLISITKEKAAWNTCVEFPSTRCSACTQCRPTIIRQTQAHT